jgi:hypothetical protein
VRPWKDTTYFLPKDLERLIEALPLLIAPAGRRYKPARKGNARKQSTGFLCLSTEAPDWTPAEWRNGKPAQHGVYQIKAVRRRNTAINESLAALEQLIDELEDDVDLDLKDKINRNYRRLADIIGE